MVVGCEDQPRFDGAIATNGLQKDRDDEEASLQDEPLDVLCHQPKVRRTIAEQPARQKRLLSGPLLGSDVEEEPEQDEGADSHEQPDRRDSTLWDDDNRPDGKVLASLHPSIRAGLQNAQHDEEQSRRRKHRAEDVEARLGSLNTRILESVDGR